jgi:hypothetical protein
LNAHFAQLPIFIFGLGPFIEMLLEQSFEQNCYFGIGDKYTIVVGEAFSA